MKLWPRLLLRNESIASSKIEGTQLGVRELERAEAKMESRIEPGATAKEVLANVDAMVLAVDEAAEVKRFGAKWPVYSTTCAQQSTPILCRGWFRPHSFMRSSRR
jgi:Fic family protein